MTDFGQSVFGQSVFGHRVLPANFGQSVFGQSVFGQSVFGQSVCGQFVCVCVLCVLCVLCVVVCVVCCCGVVWCGVVCCCVLLCVVGGCVCGSCWWCGCWFGPPYAPSAGPPKISLFCFPSFRSFCLSLCVFSLNFGGVFEGRDPEICTFGLSGCRVKPRRLRGRRGFTRQPENSKRAHLTPPALQTPQKFHEKTPRERQKEQKWGGRGKKSAKFWPPHPSGPPPFGAALFLGLAPNPSGPHPSGPHRL